VKTLKGENVFSTSLGQRFLLVLVAINLLILSFFMFSSSRFSTAETKVFSLAQSTSTSVVFTQRETLAFTTKFAQWIGGQVPKRDVLIAKAFLVQRLSVINTDGQTTAELVEPQFLDLLRDSDAILEQAPEGVLPLALRSQFALKSNDVIDQLLFNSRQLTVTYQQKLDAQLLKSTQERSRNTLNSLLALISFIILSTALLIWGIFTFRSQYGVARKLIEEEEQALVISQALLKKAETTVKSLEELNRIKNDFVATVNHELRTPLTSIIGYTQLLKTLDLTKDGAQFEKITSVIDRNSKVLLDIIESILSLSSLDSVTQPPRLEQTDLVPLVESKIFILKPMSDAKSLSINFHHDPNSVFAILGNSGQISQVILNLLSNAMKFSPQKSRIDIYLTAVAKQGAPQSIQLVIKDQGMGIPEADIPKLFTRFNRASNAVSGQIVGTGLGLAIVARILELHKATIRVESEVNKGSSFIVEFPRYISEVEQHISKHRSSVLFKAITAIKASPHGELIRVCHEMSGAVGFYELADEMEKISAFQSWYETNPDSAIVLVDIKRDELISSLEESFSALSNVIESDL
jgi:signal transduction histidine kinase